MKQNPEKKRERLCETIEKGLTHGGKEGCKDRVPMRGGARLQKEKTFYVSLRTCREPGHIHTFHAKPEESSCSLEHNLWNDGSQNGKKGARFSFRKPSGKRDVSTTEHRLINLPPTPRLNVVVQRRANTRTANPAVQTTL